MVDFVVVLVVFDKFVFNEMFFDVIDYVCECVVLWCVV